eukprot:3127505-Amphidinium_carterae.1
MRLRVSCLHQVRCIIADSSLAGGLESTRLHVVSMRCKVRKEEFRAIVFYRMWSDFAGFGRQHTDGAACKSHLAC